MKILLNSSLFLVILLTTALISERTFACSTFKLKNKKDFVYGYNMDYPYNVKAFVVINKKNIKKTAFMFEPDKPTEWTSKYNSISFNPFGPEMPFAGMNKKGLFIATTGLNYAGMYPAKDSRPTIDSIQWIQYQLDNFATVKEIINNINHIRISRRPYFQNYFIGDKKGNVAMIQPLKGKMIVYEGSDLPIPLLTNYKYGKSLKKFIDFLVKHGTKNLIQNTEKMKPTGDGFHDDTRFIKGAYLIEKYEQSANKPPLFEYAQKVLSTIKSESIKWQILAEPKNLKLYYQTFRNSKLRVIDLNKINFNSKDTIMNWDDNLKNGIPNFKKWTVEKNKGLMFSNFDIAKKSQPFYKKLFTPELEQTCKKLAEYPETFKEIE